MLTTFFFLTLVTWASSSDALVHLTGKQLHRGKVFGSGFSVTAKSLSQCMQSCNIQNTTCDGVVYHEIINKCRLLKKCAVAVQVDNSTSAVYYSKRPMIPSEGYLYLEPSDSCLGLQTPLADYASSDRGCQHQNGRLAILRSMRGRNAAIKLLTKAKKQWAWIGENKTGNRVQGYAKPKMEVPKNGTIKGCWAVNNNGTWGQFPCKNSLLPSLCQILPFPV